MKNIVLTGLMGSGKSSVAKSLNELAPDFELIETDSLIENLEKTSINEIFKVKGESYFRQIEKQVVEKLLLKENQIISLGGGSLESNLNQELFKNSVLFYLKTDIDTIYERIKNSTNRPLLKCDNPKEKLKKLLLIREKNYLKADYIIDTNKSTPKDLAKEIWRIYKNGN